MEPSYYSEGTDPRRTDTKLRITTKILGRLQNAVGALVANNPRRTDTRRIIKQKWLNALVGTAYNG